MKVNDFPKVTVILRGYTYDQIHTVVKNLIGTELKAVEITMNTPGALETIRKIREEFGDSILVGAGTVHGLYATKPCLDYELVKELDAAIGVPIVMHGGSGVSEADYDIAIENGVRKVNYYTYMAKSGGEAAREYAAASEPVYFHDLANAAIAAMRSNVEEALRIFAHHKEQ